MREFLASVFLFSLFAAPTAGQTVIPCETEESEDKTVTRCRMHQVQKIEKQPDERIRHAEVGLHQVDSQTFMRLRTMSTGPNFAETDTAAAVLRTGNRSYIVPFHIRSQMRNTSRPSFERTEAILTEDHLGAIGRADTLRFEAGQAVLRLPAGVLRKHANQLID
jgi:hypothetical protein